jgi:hypothetical protein
MRPNIQNTIELFKALEPDFLKGGRPAQIGEIRDFGGRPYIKTANGWAFHGKGTGKKAKGHVESTKSKSSIMTAALHEHLSRFDLSKDQMKNSRPFIHNKINDYAHKVGIAFTSDEKDQIIKEHKATKFKKQTSLDLINQANSTYSQEDKVAMQKMKKVNKRTNNTTVASSFKIGDKIQYAIPSVNYPDKTQSIAGKVVDHFGDGLSIELDKSISYQDKRYHEKNKSNYNYNASHSHRIAKHLELFDNEINDWGSLNNLKKID